MNFEIAKFLFSSLAVATLLSMTSCSDDDDNKGKFKETTIDLKSKAFTYNEQDIWDGTFTQGDFTISPLHFSHEGVKSSWGDYFTGFTLSNAKGNNPNTDITTSQFNVMARKGVNDEGTLNPFLVAYWNSSEAADASTDERSLLILRADNSSITKFVVNEIEVCNTVYAYYAMLDGTMFSSKFEEGDYLKIIAHGLTPEGTENKLEFYLAKCEGNPEKWYVTSWTKWSLAALGEIEALWFTMESSDTGQWGMNTPSYFAIGSIRVKTQTSK